MHTKTNRPSRGGSKFNKSSSRWSKTRKFNGGNNRSRRGGKKMPTFDPSQFINKNPVDIKEEVYKAKNTFADFNLDSRLSKTVTSMGIIDPSPIQDQIIPEIMAGNDVIGLAETGTGKTAAFLVPLIEKVIHNNDRQNLILAPTRELAIQIENELWRLSKGLRIFSVTCVGGINIRPQISKLRKFNHFVIGTPGRVMDLMDRGSIRASYIGTVVLDEADRMLDMGFIGDIRKIIGETPDSRETLFFSATMDDKTQSLVNDFLKDPVTISVKKKDVTNSIEQDVVEYTKDDKFETLVKLFESNDLDRVIIFCGMKHAAEKLSKELNKSRIHSDSIHGDKNHGQRQRALKSFKAGEVKVLVATDVAARGIHVDNVSHVINYDLPNTFEDYVHRIGRTGRGTKKGKALTFVAKRK
jgi:ATP-dependent RNA helicase RhlE